jgi:uncharacterized protein (TIGR03067 family)
MRRRLGADGNSLPASLVAYYTFDDGTARDLAGGDNNGDFGSGDKAPVFVSDAPALEETRTPSSAVSSGSAASQQSSADLAKLQGTWYAIAEEFNGAKSTATEIRRLEKTLTIKGDQFAVERLMSDGQIGKLFTGLITIDATQNPKQFDWTGTQIDGKPVRMLGLYELTNENMRVVYKLFESGADGQRPTRFASSGEGGGTVVITFGRQPLE